MPLGGGKLVMFRQADLDLPAHSLDATAGINIYLEMAAVDYGTAADRQKLSISMWVKPEAGTPAGTITLYRIAGAGASTANIQIQYLPSGSIRLQTNFTSSGSLSLDSTTDVSDDAWHHVYGVIDTSLGVDADRMKLFIDGVSEGTHGALSLNDTTSNGGNPTALAAGAASATTNPALVYQAAFFESNVPGIGDLYNAGNPKSVVGLSGLYSNLDVAGGTVTSDGVIGTAWTNNGGLVNSSDIP